MLIVYINLLARLGGAVALGRLRQSRRPSDRLVEIVAV